MTVNPCWHFAIDSVPVSCDGHALWTLSWNQHFPLPYVVSGVFTQISIAKVFFRFSGEKNTFVDLSRSAGCLCDVTDLSLDARLRAIGMLQGGSTQVAVADRFGAYRNTVQSRYTLNSYLNNISLKSLHEFLLPYQNTWFGIKGVC